MTLPQALSFGIIAATMALFAWGRLRYDLVALLRVSTNDEMASLVTGHLLRVDGVAHTETLTAFQAYSRHDLERMFGL